MSPDARKLSTLDIFPSLEDGDRVLVLRPDAPDPKDRVGMAAIPASGAPLYIAYTLTKAQQDLADSVDLTAGARYDITGNWNAAGAPATVFVQALRNDAFSPSGILLTGGVYSVVRVNVPDGTTSPVASYEVQAQHTQQLADLTALVPTKATPTNQFATLADVGQISFVDVPLTLTSGSYRIPADCAGKRFIINDGTASTFINLAALNNNSVGKAFAISITNGVRQQVRAVAFGSFVGGGLYIELAETALLVGGKQAAGPGFYYDVFRIGPPAFDPYEVSLDVRQAVADGFANQDTAANTSPFLEEPQPVGSLVGMEFVDPQTRFVYTYRPVAFANGTFNVWCSTKLSR